MKSPHIIFTDSILDGIRTQVVTSFGELPPIIPAQPNDYFGKLCESIISQQLSTKVADIIAARVRTTVGGTWNPESVLKIGHDSLRAAGLSNAKANYVKNIALAWAEGTINSEKLASQSDAEVIAELVTIKGVGQWTAEMFLIFTLGRPDVFSAGDYGLRKAISTAYTIDMKAKPATFLAISESWQPQRSLASRLLWKSLELA